MWTFLSDLVRPSDASYTVLLIEEDSAREPRRYQVTPRHVFWLCSATLLAVSLFTASLVAFTPVRQLIPGYGTETMERNAQLNAVRVTALQDTLNVQRQYIERLQQLLTGRADATSPSNESSENERPSPSSSSRPDSEDTGWTLHQQPALTITQFGGSDSSSRAPAGSVADLPALPAPVPPPVETGYPTRGFEPRDEHYAVDIAVQEGTFVRTVGDGYVVLADWTQEGGYTVAIQHGDGYLSVYKHNERIMKRIGDYVRAQEVIAVTGNSGEITTGPHLHFELWHHGLAQDPRTLVAGW
ncbi:peptidase M24 [Longimonas halophila]|uniref:Peptidase M24 n=1 Tax=Longimonas halophila TaxID=1469170 RepID=A0A2H3NUU2_9BACT|nr:peptidoglycan DD-metalloendopeptidase family protein [Longimonas halophila]PEN05433.1 peptidase M24 [Longimonas halophila]